MQARLAATFTIATVAAVSCTESYDVFDFSGQGTTTPSGGTTSSTTTGAGGAAGATATAGTGGAGAEGGLGGMAGTGGSGGSGGGSAATCASQYAVANVYEVCGESPSECELRVDVDSGQSCADICVAGGGQCLSVYNDAPNESCNRGELLFCAYQGYTSVLCICSRG